MDDLTETTLTEATLAQMADTADPRLKEIMEAAVKHLHAFARDVSLKPEEWLFGIKFLTAVGQHPLPPGIHPAVRHARPQPHDQHPA